MQHAHAQDQTYLFDTLEDGLVGVSTGSCKWAYFWKDGASPLLDFLCLQVGGKGEERYSKMTERKVLGPHTGGNFKPKTKRAIMSVVGTAWWKQVGAQRKVKNKNEKNPRRCVISCVKAAKCGHTYLCVGTEFLYPRVYPSSTSRRQLRLGAILILCQWPRQSGMCCGRVLSYMRELYTRGTNTTTAPFHP